MGGSPGRRTRTTTEADPRRTAFTCSSASGPLRVTSDRDHHGTRADHRLAADTPIDRCEDVQPDLKTGKLYVVCTNNSDRGKAGKPGTDAPNPRAENKNGHIVEITERKGRADATTFTWDLFLVCGDEDQAGTYFGGWDGPVAPISCPDNIAFDSVGNLTRARRARGTSSCPTSPTT